MTYYNYYGIECYELLQLFLQPAKKEQGFYLGNVIKYVYRAGIKDNEDEISDIKKALTYFENFLSVVSNGYKQNFQVEISFVKYVSLIKIFHSMPYYKEVFFLQLLYCAISGKWKGIEEIYRTLQTNTKELNVNENTRRNEN